MRPGEHERVEQELRHDVALESFPGGREPVEKRRQFARRDVTRALAQLVEEAEVADRARLTEADQEKVPCQVGPGRDE